MSIISKKSLRIFKLSETTDNIFFYIVNKADWSTFYKKAL